MLEGNSATLKFLSFEGFEQKLTHLVLSPGLFSKSSFLQILSSLPYPPERPRFFSVLHASLPFVIERVWAGFRFLCEPKGKSPPRLLLLVLSHMNCYSGTGRDE
jgi:hypothetical protein